MQPEQMSFPGADIETDHNLAFMATNLKLKYSAKKHLLE